MGKTCFAVMFKGGLTAEKYLQGIDKILIKYGLDPEEHDRVSVVSDPVPLTVYVRDPGNGELDLSSPVESNAIEIPAFKAIQGNNEKAHDMLKEMANKWKGVAFCMKTSDSEEPVLIAYVPPGEGIV